jgi:hypothetical protein
MGQWGARMTSTGGFAYLRTGAERAAEFAAANAAETQPEEPQTAAEAAATDDYPEDGTIPEVKAWIGDSIERANEAFDRESDRANPRSTLIDWLQDFIEESSDEPEATS